jgi:hypothetical protein
MYLAIVVLLMGALPVLSVVAETAWSSEGADVLIVVGRWFVFWPVGVRLLLAGVRQCLNPAYTAETIFGCRDPIARKLVVEIGFGNLAMGTVGAVSLAVPGWLVPAALLGAIYYGLAGLGHLRGGERNRIETIAMVSDLFIAAVLVAWLLARAAVGAT